MDRRNFKPWSRKSTTPELAPLSEFSHHANGETLTLYTKSRQWHSTELGTRRLRFRDHNHWATAGASIATLFKRGKSYEIAKIVGRSHSCVQKIIGRFKSDGLIENGSGRKSILSDVAKRKVLKDIKIDPKLSAVKLAAETSRIMG
ncbi:HTH_Tnp_Tc3_2 domain-containing protein [Trichonephila clavipes]|nr:HTH_Tnp_Tc3_2 domain-containing protein [Trichonephila clavipes]